MKPLSLEPYPARFGLQQAFSIPYAELRWPEAGRLNTALRATVLAHRCVDPGVRVSNRGGWHSAKDLQDWPEACIAELKARIFAALKLTLLRLDPALDERHLQGWRLIAWANVNPQGAVNASHQHSSLWSGVYYVDCGGAAPGGELVLENDFGVPVEVLDHPDPYRTDLRLRPEDGLMLLFPSSVFHRVEAHGGEGLRISIAFDLSHPGFARPDRSACRENWRWRNFRGVMRLALWLEEAGYSAQYRWWRNRA